MPKGGKRKGAGKPALYGKPMKRYNVILDDETVKYMRSLGGNLSKGIRAAAVLNGKVSPQKKEGVYG